MSLYNMMNGVNLATFFILPMLGKHADEYPRFRDCFIEKRHFEIKDGLPVMVPMGEKNEYPVICVYTRVGGGNRESYQSEIDILQSMEGYIEDFDDDFDSTFATFVFRVPEAFISDYELVKEGKLMETSQKYKDLVDKVYPKLKGKLPWHKKEAQP